GDIRNARVQFVNRDAGNSPIGPLLTPVLVSAADQKVGTVSCSWSCNIGQADSVPFTIGIVVTNYYGDDAGAEDSIVTVSKPLTGFITGGGYLSLTNSAGPNAGDVGSRNNFGFNVKYNKALTNLQGSLNCIVRRTVSGVVHTYQVKSNAINGLSINS